MDAKLRFIADKMSGLGASIFATSMVIAVIPENDRQNIFKFQFYALSIDDKEQKCIEWIHNDLYHQESMRILEYINKNSLSYFEKVKELVSAQSADFFQLATTTIPNISKLSDIELVREYNHFMNCYIEYYGLGCVTFIYESELSQHLHDSLAARYENVADILTPLLASSYRSFMTEGESILLQIQQEKNAHAKKELVKEYLEKHFFIKASYTEAPILNEATVLALAEKVRAPAHQNMETVQKRAGELSTEEKNLVALFRETEIIRDQRKRTNLIGSYTMFRFLDEVCRRKNIPFERALRMFWFELAEAIVTPDKLLATLEKRNEVSLIYDQRSVLYLEYSAITARNSSTSTTTEIKGTPASRGKVSGVARIVLSQRDFHTFTKGEILIAEMTRPDFVPLMKEALAIITDEGGLTCHAAIVARELGIPCIVGTRVATNSIKNGDLVEVDADSGVVKILERAGE